MIIQKEFLKIALGLISFLLVITAAVWFLWPTSQKQSTGQVSSKTSNLFAQEGEFDFGNVSMAAGKVSHFFKIKNTTSEPITLTKVYTSCMCTTATLKIADRQKGPFGMPGHGPTPNINEILGAGDEGEVEVVFDPAAHGPAGIGQTVRIVYLKSKDAAPLELKILANVTP